MKDLINNYFNALETMKAEKDKLMKGLRKIFETHEEWEEMSTYDIVMIKDYWFYDNGQNEILFYTDECLRNMSLNESVYMESDEMLYEDRYKAGEYTIVISDSSIVFLITEKRRFVAE